MEPVRPIKINLLDTERKSEQKPLFILISLVLVLAVLGLMGGMYAISLGRLHSEQARNDSLQAKYHKYQRSENASQIQREATEAIRNKRRMIETLEESRVSYLDLLAEVEKASPEGIRLYNLDIDSNKIIITGKTADANNVAILLAGLRASPWFKQVHTVSISDEGKTADGLMRFDVEYEWGVVQR